MCGVDLGGVQEEACPRTLEEALPYDLGPHPGLER